MIKTENQCVDCGLPCIGDLCKYKNVIVRYCDRCKSDGAVYEMNGENLCSDCASEIVKDIFDDMTLREKAEVCGVHLIDWR